MNNTSSKKSDSNDIRAAVQLAVMKICADEDAASSTKTSARALAALSELTYQYAVASLAPDLDNFSDHAGRKRITEQDVKLVVRKNPAAQQRVQDRLREYTDSAEVLFVAPQKLKARKKKTQKAEFSENSSTSEEEMPVTRVVARKTMAMFDGEDSSDDLEAIKAVIATKKKPASKSGAQVKGQKSAIERMGGDSDSSIEHVKPPEQKAPFRLQPQNRFSLPGKHHSASNSSDDENLDDLAEDTTAAIATTKTQSRVEDILANMSEDSLPDDNDDGMS